MSTLDDLVRAGKIRYIGCSNFSGWHLMKSLAVSEKYGYLALRRASGVLLTGWPHLRMGTDAAGSGSKSWSRRVESAGLGETHRQNPARPAGCRPTRSACNPSSMPMSANRLPMTIFTPSWMRLMKSRKETGKTVPQIALNWLLQRPTVSTLHHRCAERRTAPRQSRSGRLEAHPGADCQA